MGVDLTVLVLTIAALARNSLHSQMWKLLFQDGLIYFCITFACNAVPAILNVLNLNSASASYRLPLFVAHSFYPQA